MFQRKQTVMTVILCALWLMLMAFGALSVIGPEWLKSLSRPGRRVEARDYKDHGDNFLRKGDYGRAIAHYQKALFIRPELTGATVNLAVAHSQFGDVARAEQLLRDALKSQPSQKGIIYFHLAQLAEKRKKNTEAIALYRQALGTEFPAQTVRAKLGGAYFNEGRFAEAKEAFESALRLQENPATAYRDMLLSTLSAFEEEDTTQLEVLRAMLARDILPEDLAPYDLEIIRQEQAHDPDLSNLYANLGVSCAKLGELDQALVHLERALEIWSGNTAARRNLDMLRRLRSEQTVVK